MTADETVELTPDMERDGVQVGHYVDNRRVIAPQSTAYVPTERDIRMAWTAWVLDVEYGIREDARALEVDAQVTRFLAEARAEALEEARRHLLAHNRSTTLTWLEKIRERS